MGVDYNASGGIGIRVTDDMLDILAKHKDVVREKVSDSDLVDGNGIMYCIYGDAWGGDENFAFVLDAETYVEAVKEVPLFLEKVNALGFHYTENDLEIIVEQHIW